MKKPVLAVALALTVAFTVVADDKVKPDEDKRAAVAKARADFAGTWEIASVWPEGITGKARKLDFRDDRTYAALDQADEELWAGTYDLDPTASPGIWDHRSYESWEKGGDALGIYELKGDTLRVACVVGKWADKKWAGKPRPTEFKLPNADVVLELRRVKPEAKRQDSIKTTPPSRAGGDGEETAKVK